MGILIIYTYDKWVNTCVWVLDYIIGLSWVLVIPTLLNKYKWIIGFSIHNPFKSHPFATPSYGTYGKQK
jgi:hypothetical protein